MPLPGIDDSQCECVCTFLSENSASTIHVLHVKLWLKLMKFFGCEFCLLLKASRMILKNIKVCNS